MVQGYYTLPEAAKFLAMSVDELKQMAQKGQIRSFQDRGTLRFRIQDIQEMARLRGASTDPEVVLGDASLPPPKSSATPPSGARKSHTSPKTPAKQQAASVPEVFDFDFDEEKVDIGADLPISAGSGTKSKPGSKGSKKAPRTPQQAGSDSDVRLVSDGSDVTFSIPKESAPKPPDSDVKISPDPVLPKSGPKRPSQLALGSGAKAKPGSSATKPVSPRPELPPDSGVRLVGLDSDSDVKLVGTSDDVPLGGLGDSTATDSNVRLDRIELPPADSDESNLMLTDEIDLDAEMQKLDKLKKSDPPTKLKPKSELKLPTGSPFELSDSELDVPSELKGDAGPKTPRMPKKDDSSDYELATQSPTDGSSDFDLIAADDGSILLEGSDSNDFSLAPGDDHEQVLEDHAEAELTSASSGISLNNPVDAGISLEGGAGDSGESLDFDLSLEPEDTPKPAASRPIGESDSEFELAAHKTPKPRKAQPGESADSEEFDLSLDADDSDGSAPAMQDSGDSNFELNLENSDESEASDSSEFELTLDDSGNLAAAEDDEPAPQVKAKKKGADGEEQDIFETDFEVPALDDSDDATVADSELESSDFDLALDDSELAAEDESGSQVVALDEEDAGALPESDEDAAVADDVQVEEESSDFADMDEDVQVGDDDAVDVDVDEDAETAGPRQTVIKRELIQPAPWGVVPVIFMLPCVIVMVLVGILGYELVQSSANLKPPGPLTMAIAEMVGQKVTLK